MVVRFKLSFGWPVGQREAVERCALWVNQCCGVTSSPNKLVQVAQTAQRAILAILPKIA